MSDPLRRVPPLPAGDPTSALLIWRSKRWAEADRKRAERLVKAARNASQHMAGTRHQTEAARPAEAKEAAK